MVQVLAQQEGNVATMPWWSEIHEIRCRRMDEGCFPKNQRSEKLRMLTCERGRDHSGLDPADLASAHSSHLFPSRKAKTEMMSQRARSQRCEQQCEDQGQHRGMKLEVLPFRLVFALRPGLSRSAFERQYSGLEPPGNMSFSYCVIVVSCCFPFLCRSFPFVSLSSNCLVILRPRNSVPHCSTGSGTW